VKLVTAHSEQLDPSVATGQPSSPERGGEDSRAELTSAPPTSTPQAVDAGESATAEPTAGKPRRREKKARPWHRRVRWRLMAISVVALAAYFVSLNVGGCARPVAGVWPPKEGQPRHKIMVALYDVHCEVWVWPADDPNGGDPTKRLMYGFADRHWYLEENNDWLSTARALVLPTEGVIQVSWLPPPPEKPEFEPNQTWTFYISPEGYDRLNDYLESEKATSVILAREPESVYYHSKRSYHVFNHCNIWTARALRRAGLPIWPSHALFNFSLKKQLDRAEAMGERLAPPPQP